MDAAAAVDRSDEDRRLETGIFWTDLRFRTAIDPLSFNEHAHKLNIYRSVLSMVLLNQFAPVAPIDDTGKSWRALSTNVAIRDRSIRLCYENN